LFVVGEVVSVLGGYWWLVFGDKESLLVVVGY
jgi:hypothetical protein